MSQRYTLNDIPHIVNKSIFLTQTLLFIFFGLFMINMIIQKNMLLFLRRLYSKRIPV